MVFSDCSNCVWDKRETIVSVFSCPLLVAEMILFVVLEFFFCQIVMPDMLVSSFLLQGEGHVRFDLDCKCHLFYFN